jgi:hemerythrin-like domain-containing protein
MTMPAPTPRTEVADDPFDRLTREHRVVESLLRVIDALADRAAGGGIVERRALGTVVEFLTEYGELGHHEREEGILTPVLIANGFDWFEGPLATVRREHRQEHYFYRVLGQLALQPDAWSSEDVRRFVSVARELTRFLRAHMQREEEQLFSVARQRLSAETKAALLAAFDRFDRSSHAETILAALEERRHRLLEEYSIH